MQEGVLKAERTDRTHRAHATDGTASSKPPLTILGLLHGAVPGGERCAAGQQRFECPLGGMQEKVFEPDDTDWTHWSHVPLWPH